MKRWPKGKESKAVDGSRSLRSCVRKESFEDGSRQLWDQVALSKDLN